METVKTERLILFSEQQFLFRLAFTLVYKEFTKNLQEKHTKIYTFIV